MLDRTARNEYNVFSEGDVSVNVENKMLKKAPTFLINCEKNILGGRQTGDKIREQVIARIKGNPLDTIMPLNFEQVQFLDYSCADELICKLVRRIMIRDFSERYILISAVNDIVRENLEAALKERKMAVPGIDKNDQIILYGDISQEMKETYNFAVKREIFTARNIAEAGLVPDKKINSASNRITKLYDMALVRKVSQENVGGGGRQYVYEAVR